MLEAGYAPAEFGYLAVEGDELILGVEQLFAEFCF
jgi:hypothetical protein